METRIRQAAGFILASEMDGERVYLLLRNARHGAWGFPKGHAEEGETVLETARRETLEETGISDFKQVAGFEWRDEYKVRAAKRGDYRKRVVYFLATTRRAVHVQSDEHSDSAWLPLKQALALLQFENLRKALAAADEALNRL